MNTQPISSSELPLTKDGAVYHLNLQPEQIAGTCLLVGDPGRVSVISAFFDRIDHKVENREMITHTGIYKGKPLSVISTGMGTDNIDIVVNELDALVNIDLKTRLPKTTTTSLNLIRIGTCGSFQADININKMCASTHALGLDGLLNYYKTTYTAQEEEILNAFIAHTNYPENLAKPYLVSASPILLEVLAKDMQKGITATASGFYAPQGRKIRIPLQYPSQNELFTSFSYQNHRITNMEMESSALYGLGRALNHHCLTICLVVANRITKEFNENYPPILEKEIEKLLNSLLKIKEC